MLGKISQDTTVAFKPSILIPGVDLTLQPGAQNINMTAASLQSSGTLGAPVTPQQFGAVGDGVHDDTAAFNAALASIAAAGGNGKLYIPPGHYKLTAPLSYTSGYLHIEGAGTSAELDFNNPTADMMTFTGTNIQLSDFRVLTPYQTSTAGSLFNFRRASNISLARVQTDGGYEVVQFLGAPGALSYRTTISGCSFVNVMSNAVFYDQYFGGIGIVSDTDMLAAPLNNTTGNGIIIEAGDTFTFTNINIQGFPIGIEATSKTGGINYVANIFAANVLCDGGGGPAGLLDGWVFDGSTAGTYVARVHLSGCWAGSDHRHGFYVVNANEVTFSNCIAVANAGHGFLVVSPSNNVTLTGCTALANSNGASNMNDGIHIQGPVTDLIITGCRANVITAFGGATQRYGIFIDASANDRYVISNNNVHGNVTGGLADTSTGSPSRFVSQNIL